MTTIGILITAIIAAMCSGVACDIIDYCIDQHKKKDYEKLDKHKDYIIGHMDYNGNMNKQIVYKVDGDFNGDIKGDNVTVILMGNGNFNGDINSKDGEVVVIKGDINGDVKANKVLCPTDPSVSDKEVDDNYRNCQSYKPVNRHNDDNTTKHNPAKNVKSPKLQVETLWSCDIPQSASPYERIDFTYDGDKCVNRYKSLALTNVTCPHCRKSFSKNLRVVTTVVDGEVSNTEIQNYDGYILG